MAQYPIVCCARDDATIYCFCSNLPAGMSTGTLAQGDKRHMDRILLSMPYPSGCPKARVPTSADPVNRTNHSGHTQTRFDVSPTSWAEPSSSQARFVWSSRQSAFLRLPQVAVWRLVDLFLITHRRYSSQHVASSSLAILPPGLPTGSKADASSEATGKTERLAFALQGSHLSELAKTLTFVSQHP